MDANRGLGSGRLPATTRVMLLGWIVAAAPCGDGAVPTAPPTFTEPLKIDNSFSPFTPGAVHVLRGKSDGEKFLVTMLQLPDTRTFAWGGGQVEARVLREVEFEAGELVEISDNYFAQADDGTVYHFGEVVTDYEEGAAVGHDGSWLVGGPTAPDDPTGAANVSDPRVFMPANPEVGDQFSPEPGETVTVQVFVKKVKTGAGKFQDVMQVQEVSGPPDDETEKKWYVRGIGVIRTQGGGEKLELVASTLEPITPP